MVPLVVHVPPPGRGAGQSVRLNEALTVVEAGDFERVGEVCGLREVLSEPTTELAGRALVVGHADEERVVWLAAPLTLPADDPAYVPLKPGDSLLVDTKAGYVYDRSRLTQMLRSWGLVPAPGTAQAAQYQGCRDGRVVADVVRLDKGHTEGLEPKVTEEIIKLMLSAPGGKIQRGGTM